MKMFLVILTAFSVLVLGCSENGSNDATVVTSERFGSLKESIIEKIEKGEIPSLSVAVVDNGNMVWMESFGFADKENRIEATPNTLYTIASISKPMTATGIMKLVEDGELDLDADIQTYLNDTQLDFYVNNTNSVTCRNLLSHTSGLPMHFQYYYDDAAVAIPDITQVIDRYGIIVNQPSSKYVYANLGYGILGKVISDTTGKSFNDYMTDEVFTPLGMTHTTLDISPKTKSKLAKRYDIKGKLIPFSFADTPGAANVSTTIRDLIRFGMFHLGSSPESGAPLLSLESVQSMQEPQYPDNTNGRNTYGLGWFIDDGNYKCRMVHHGGGMDGVDAMIRLLPERGIVVAAISNQYTEYTHQLTEQILLEMVPDLKRDEATQTEEEDPGVQEEFVEIEQSDLIGQWNGHIVTHDIRIPTTIVFQEDGDIHVNMPVQFESMILGTHVSEVEHSILLNKWFFTDGHFMGWYAGDIPGEHLTRCPQITMLDLEYRSGKLMGTAVAMASSGNRMHYGISHYFELEKAEGEQVVR